MSIQPIRFEHLGQQFTLHPRNSARFYSVQFMRDRVTYRKSLETHDAATAIERAKVFISEAVFVHQQRQRAEKLALLRQRYGDVPQLAKTFGVVSAGTPLASIPAPIGLWDIAEPAPGDKSRLADLFDIYRKVALIQPRSVKNNILALKQILETVQGGEIDPEKIRLEAINRGLVFAFQERVALLYAAGMPEGSSERREALERALRSSRSVISQARSIFSARGIDLPDRYEAAGLKLPECVSGFVTVKLRGRRHRSTYNVAPPEAIANAFAAVEQIRLKDLPVFFAFWCAVGAGLRRGEISRLKFENFRELDGVLWIDGNLTSPTLIGKNGEAVYAQVQTKAADNLRPFLGERGAVVDSRFHARLNRLLRECGFRTTRLAMHELRAYTASKLFELSPRAAQQFCRHASLTTTERAYSRYANRAAIPQVL